MLLGRHPEVAIAPAAKIPQLLDFFMVVLVIVLHREAHGIVDANVAAEAEK